MSLNKIRDKDCNKVTVEEVTGASGKMVKQ